MSRPPLDGLRVVAVSQFGASPFGTQALAELGAEVIKRGSPPPYISLQHGRCAPDRAPTTLRLRAR